MVWSLRRNVVVALSIVGIAIPPVSAHAQGTLPGEMAVLGANVLVGGLTSGVTAWLRGRSFVEGFGRGAAGGSVHYIGKRLAASSVPGGGLAGRVVGATGSSMVRNGAADRGLLERLALPVGPVTVYWTSTPDSQRIRTRINIGRTIFLARLAIDDELRLDWAETLSAGAPIFQAPGRVIQGETGSEIGGLELWGTVSLSDLSLLPPTDHGRLIAHERVHLVQDDFLYLAWADPAEDWLLDRVPGGPLVGRYADIGALYMGMAALLILSLQYQERPWEAEAAYMETGW